MPSSRASGDKIDEGNEIAPAVFKIPDLEELEDYEDYLDCFVTWKDRFYLESDEIPRIIASLGFRIPEVMHKENFDKMVQTRLELRNRTRNLVFAGDLVKNNEIICPLMRALHLREHKNRSRRMQTIVFIRDTNKKGHEISGFIDFHDVLETEEKYWMDYYLSKKKLLPNSSDLGYFNWNMNFASYNDSQNWKAIVAVGKGVQFESKLDQKIMNCNLDQNLGDKNHRENISTPHYLQCFIVDHALRKKGTSRLSTFK